MSLQHSSRSHPLLALYLRTEAGIKMSVTILVNNLWICRTRSCRWALKIIRRNLLTEPIYRCGPAGPFIQEAFQICVPLLSLLVERVPADVILVELCAAQFLIARPHLRFQFRDGRLCRLQLTLCATQRFHKPATVDPL